VPKVGVLIPASTAKNGHVIADLDTLLANFTRLSIVDAACRRAGLTSFLRGDVLHADGALNVLMETYSHGLRRLWNAMSPGSFDDAGEAVRRSDGQGGAAGRWLD